MPYLCSGFQKESNMFNPLNKQTIMLRVNYNIKYGEVTLKQKDTAFKVEIFWANALCAFIYQYKEHGKDMVRLLSFFADEKHIENCEKDASNGDVLSYILWGEIVDVRLNLYYKEANILLKHFVKNHQVTCYYKKPTE